MHVCMYTYEYILHNGTIYMYTNFHLKHILILSSHTHISLPSGLFPSGFPTVTLQLRIYLPRSCYMPRPSHSPLFCHPSNTWWRAQSMKLFITKSISLCYFLLLRIKYPSQHLFLRRIQKDTKFRKIMSQSTTVEWRKTYSVTRVTPVKNFMGYLQQWHYTKRLKSILNSTEQSPYWEANSHSASQETARLLYNPNVHYRVHKSPPLVVTLIQMHPVHNVLSYSFQIHFSIILPSKSHRVIPVELPHSYFEIPPPVAAASQNR